MKKFLLALAFAAPLGASPLSHGAEAGYPLDRSPHRATDVVSLQSGARTYANYCLGCHGLQFMRYSGLKELGLTEDQVRDNLMFTADKVGEPIKATFNPKEAKQWFGVAPPDLSVIARSRGADWLYTYLRTFYRDEKAASGWNNAVFPNVGMPHALWTLQGERALKEAPHEGEGHGAPKREWVQLSKGLQSPTEYDATVRDLVNFLVYAGEPSAVSRKNIGIVVLFVLGVLFILAYLLKLNYWKDVK
jgi:ubiquinol-cytochrome c reductase cytochrome c1 subunit